MKKIILNQIEYELIQDYKNAFHLEDITDKYTDYFEEFDYIVGDYSYDKLRLKGFYRPENPKQKELNNYENVHSYLTNFCSYECRYFILEKKKNEKNT